MAKRSRKAAGGPGGSTLAEAPAGLGEFRWVHPETLVENPANASRHTPEQEEAVRQLLLEVGWVVPLAVNLRKGHLVNGHLRRKIALAWPDDYRSEVFGTANVPVVFGDWDDAQEARILAFLDATTALKGIDSVKFEALRGRLAEAQLGDPLARLRDQIRTDPFFKAGISGPRPLLGQAPIPAGPLAAPVASYPAGGAPAPASPNGGAPAPMEPIQAPVRIRQIPLYFEDSRADSFVADAERLMGHYQLDNLTDAVARAVEEVAAQLGPAGGESGGESGGDGDE